MFYDVFLMFFLCFSYVFLMFSYVFLMFSYVFFYVFLIFYCFMSIRGIVEILVHLQSFRNIDLFRQGKYYFKVEVFYTINGRVINASPYAVHHQPFRHKKNKKIGEIDDICYKTRGFYIKYCDENYEIDEIAVFRTEIDALSNSETPELTILISLLYSNAPDSLSSQIFENHAKSPPFLMKESYCELKIPNFLQGANSFIPINFDNSHFCVVNSTVHVIPVDFRYRTRQMLTVSEENSRNQDTSQSADVNINEKISEILFPDKNFVDSALFSQTLNKFIKVLENAEKTNAELLNE